MRCLSRGRWLPALVVLLAGAAVADGTEGNTPAGVEAPDADTSGDADTPGLDFLEYLGSWQDSDEDWLWVIEWDPENEDLDAVSPDDSQAPETEVRQ